MKVTLRKLALLMMFSVLALGAWAAVSEYSFTSSIGTYTEITGGTVLGTPANDNENFNAIPLGFTFTYNGVDYTEISVQTNGFLAFGATVSTSNLAISSTTGTNNVAAALNRDLKSKADGELSYLLTGTAPNQVFVVQWKNYQRGPSSANNDILNFQIQIQQNGNKVVYAYGSFTAVSLSTAKTIQVGLRGNDNTDFNNRTTETDWAATTAGSVNNASCWLTNTVFPPNGLIFTFSPVQTGTPPMPAQNPNPAYQAINVPINTNLSWITGGGIVDGYKVYFGTETPPTSLVNGAVQTGTVYDPPANLLYNTLYYWQIVPFNTDGDAADCPIWQFTTLADPTVVTYPYLQNFDAVTVPALPLGWTTINANADAYTWETFQGNAQSAPNSIRVRYNDSLPMNDWLISPPLQLSAEMFYQLGFYYRANSASYAEALKVCWGTSPDPAALTHVLFDQPSITNVEYAAADAAFTVPSAGTYYIGFQGYSPAGRFYLYLDSVSINQLSDTMNPPTNLNATVVENYNVHLTWTAPATRALLGYKVYRGGTLINTITNPATLVYDDLDLPNATYVYGVSATYTTGESAPATVNAVVNVVLAPALLEDGFETYPDFALQFAPWTLVDVDLAPTYGISNVTFPGSGEPMAYIVFNPSATTPPITSLVPHGGAKMAASFAATTPPNNDWLVTPRIHLGTGAALRFYAKSHSSQWGLERFRVGVSTLPTIIPQGFQYVTGPDYLEAPVTWTEYMYDLSAYDGQAVYIGIRCVSDDAFVFYVDDFSVHSNGGYVSNDDPQTPVLTTKLDGNYPNPFNPETTISYSVKESTPVKLEIYNVKGQLVKTLVNEVKASGNHSVVWNGLDSNGRSTASGVYFYKMNAGKYSSTRKMIMMK